MIIGITGGIGSGKSTVSNYLKKKGYFIIDADQIARDLVKPQSHVLSLLCREFGNDIIDQNGELKRKHLGDIVFSDIKYKETLDKIMQTEIRAEIYRQIENCKDDIMFLDAPLLYEVGLDKDVDYSWLIVASIEARICRVCQRDSISKEKVLERINCQMSDDEKKTFADEIISNSSSEEDLHKQIEGLLSKYEKK